jgi:dipeptidase E
MSVRNHQTRILLGSGGIGTDERKSLYSRLVAEHFEGCSEILFVPFASANHSEYTLRMKNFLESPYSLVGIESFDDPVEAVMRSEGIYVGGGNSFLLIRSLHEMGLIEPIRDRVIGGCPYLGVSAGSNVASPSMMTTNDMPISLPPSFESFGLVPFQINPHYHPGKILFRDGDEISEHFGESRAQRIAEFHQHHEAPVLGMWEGSFVHWDGQTGELTGRATAFLRGLEPLEMESGARFDSSLDRVG